MRIIAGSLRRRPIQVPRGHEVRPTTDRTREAIFNVLAGRVEMRTAQVLDLFAGSGALGFEAISRGASSATFVEKSPQIASAIRDNAQRFGVEAMIDVHVQDAMRFVSRYHGPPFDVVLADPPYTFDAIRQLPDRLLTLVRENGLLILEHDGRYDFSDHANLVLQRTYGRTRVSLFAPGHPEPETE